MVSHDVPACFRQKASSEGILNHVSFAYDASRMSPLSQGYR